MNKRFFLALLLTGAVIVLTPLLFRGTADGPTTSADSLSAPSAQPTQVAPPVDTVSRVSRSTARAVETESTDTTAADTASLVTATLHLKFVNRGATLVGAELPHYAMLGADSAPVQLA